MIRQHNDLRIRVARPRKAIQARHSPAATRILKSLGRWFDFYKHRKSQERNVIIQDIAYISFNDSDLAFYRENKKSHKDYR
jgi:hypothetical protein